MLNKNQIGELLIVLAVVMMAVTSVTARPTPSMQRKRRPAPVVVDTVARQLQQKPRQAKDRWMSPCAGSDVVENIILSLETGDAPPSKTEFNMDSIRQTIPERIDQAVKDIDILKKNYVSQVLLLLVDSLISELIEFRFPCRSITMRIYAK